MVVKVNHEKELFGYSEEPYEGCCKCEKETPYWGENSKKELLALCEECAKKYNMKDIPTKEEWFNS
jgi:hypothetical protein